MASTARPATTGGALEIEEHTPALAVTPLNQHSRIFGDVDLRWRDDVDHPESPDRIRP